jgi:NADPH2:quinone reductase
MRRRELAALRALAEQGLARPLVSASYSLDRFAEAMQLLGDRRAIGRVALINGDQVTAPK